MLTALLSVTVLLVSGAAGVAIGAVAGPEKPDPPQSIPGADDVTKGTRVTRAEIDARLREHARALRDNERQAYLALYDDADERLIEQERQRFRNLARLPLEQVSFETRSIHGQTVDRFARGVRFRVDVDLGYQVRNVDLGPVSERYRWTVELPPGSDTLRVVRVGAPPDSAVSGRQARHPAPWDAYAEMRVVRRPHVVIMAGKEHVRAARRHADLFERAAKSTLRAWRRHGPKSVSTPPGFAVILASDRSRFAELYGQRPPDVPGKAGYTVPLAGIDTRGEQGDTAGGQAGGARIVLDVSSDAFTRGSRGEVRSLIRRELAHALLAPGYPRDGGGSARKHSPLALWVAEGFAEYMGLRGRALDRSSRHGALVTYLGQDRFDGTLPANTDMRSAGRLQVDASYRLSGLAMRYLARHHGEDTMFRLVAAHYRNPQQLKRQVRDATGLNWAEFQRAWASYVRDTID